MRPTHAQPTAEREPADPRGADLARRQPAHFAAVVRYADRLTGQGWDSHEAYRAALDAYDDLQARGEQP